MVKTKVHTLLQGVREVLEQRWTHTIGFRNILVHEYAELDRRLVCHRPLSISLLGRK